VAHFLTPYLLSPAALDEDGVGAVDKDVGAPKAMGEMLAARLGEVFRVMAVYLTRVSGSA